MSAHDADPGRPPLIPSRAAPPDAAAGVPDERSRRERLRFGTIVIVGGGCYGSYYLRQLGRAAAAGAVAWERLLVVDRDARCQVAREWVAGGHDVTVPAASQAGRTPGASLTPWPDRAPEPEVVVADWREFFRRYLGASASAPEWCAADAIVPSPLMPHLMYDWLLDRAARRWPDRTVRREPLDAVPPVPWTRAGEDGTQFVSYAEWMCPINCIEPARCPHTRGPRDWSLPPAIRAFVAAERARGQRVEGPCIFHCTHRAYGVGMIDTQDVVAADRLVELAGTAGAARVLVGTASHCHGALGVLAIGPAAG